MLLLLALPVFYAVALVHRHLQLYAPSNLLVRRVRSVPSRWRTAAALMTLTVALMLLMHAAAEAVAHGGPRWLNVLVLLLAWDAIKVGCLMIDLGLRALVSGCRCLIATARQWSNDP
jgi:hypothetical protein